MAHFAFSDDSPRTDPWSQDDLGYRPFAQRLADVLQELEAPNGYVIGVNGAWGSGKTTALNFVRHFVNDANQRSDRPLEIIWFQPWMFAGHQDLIQSFFRVLAEGLKDTAERVHSVRRRFGRGVKAVTDPLIQATVAVAAAAHPGETVAIKAGGEVARAAANHTIATWLNEPTLQAAHDDLAQRLKKSGRRFVVFIDDIDRLEPSEIRSIMQMVKSVGRLPNITYVLAYDRRIVWRAMDESSARKDGEPTFAEKIVQHELDLPLPKRRKLLSLLERDIGFILKNIRTGQRWHEIIRHGLHRWIARPRDATRLANSLRFSWSPLEGEVDPIDVIAMEGLRLFDADLFEWIRTNRDFLVPDSRYWPDEELQAVAEHIRASLGPSRRDDLIEVLSVLFSHRAKLLRGKESFSFGENWQQTLGRRGLATPHGYDAYFALFPSEHAVPKALLDDAVAAREDRAFQDQAIAKALALRTEGGQSLIGEYLEELQARMTGRQGVKPTEAILKAIVAQGDFIQRQDAAGIFLGPPTIMHFFVREMLEAWGVDEAGRILAEACEASDAPAVISSFYTWRARESGVLPDEGMRTGAIISDEGLARIGDHALRTIVAQAEDGRLAQAPYYWDIMIVWQHLGEADVAREWLMTLVEGDPHALAKVARGILTTSNGSEGVEYGYRGLTYDRPFYDFDRLLAASERFALRPELDADEAKRIAALLDGLQRERASAASEMHDNAGQS